MNSYLTKSIRWIAVITMVIALLAGASANIVSADTVQCTDPCDSAALQTAIDTAVAGDVIEVPAGTFTLGSIVTVNKDVTIHGAGEGVTIFQVSGTGHRISFTANGSGIEDVEIVKTDTLGEQNILYIAANDVTLRNITVHGQYQMGDAPVTRAIEAAGGFTGILIEDSTFYGLRQPGYLNTSEITIQNNHVYGTRGWVLEGANVNFVGNTWGTGADANAVDIAILAGTNAGYYPDLLAISTANNGAVIEDQRVSLLSHVWVDSNAAGPGIGYQSSPFTSIQAGINKVVSGGFVYVAEGEYLENNTSFNDLAITKSLSLIGAGKDLTLVKLSEGKTNGVEIYGTDLNVTIEGMTFTRRDGEDYGPGFALRIGETNSSFTGFTLRDVDVSYANGRNVQFGANGTYTGIMIEDSDFHHAGSWGMSVDGATTGLTVTGSTFTDNGSVDATHGIGLDIGNGGISDVTVTDSDFSRNTMKGLNLVKTTDALFDNITVNETGNAPDNSAFTIYEWGGGTSENITIRNSQFMNNNRMAILLGTDAGNSILDVTITGNVFVGNGNGAVFNWSAGTISDIAVHHNSILNSGDGVYDNQTPSAIVAENNWWGCNEGPGSTDCTSVSSNVDADPWLVLTPSVDAQVNPGASTGFTASLQTNSEGVDTSAQGTFPDGIEVAFTATGGTVAPVSDLTENGAAQTVYTAGAVEGSFSICAELDSETACSSVLVDPQPYLLYLPVVHR